MRITNKLVRDNIPQIISANGQKAVTKTLDRVEYVASLEQKLQEEVAEYLKDKNTAELADILEVVYALSETLNTSHEELEVIRREKVEKNGAFSKKIFLISVEE